MIIHSVGGYDLIGKNMSAVEVGEDVVVLDMGIHLEPYIQYTESDDIVEVSSKALRRVGAVPDDTVLKKKRKNVRAIIPSHAHLDHIGAIPYLANQYDCPIICTPFTAEVVKAICRDRKIVLSNKIIPINLNGSYKLTGDITVELVEVTHSTPHTAMVVLHTREGVVVYANDFKFDNHPVIGGKPNFVRLKELGDKGVKVLISDSTRAPVPVKTPSESVAKEMLRDVMLGVESQGRAVIVTTFSSHIARLKSIIEFGRELGRETVLLGRSLGKYVDAAEAAGIVNFSKEVEIVRYRSKIARKLRQVEKAPQKYLLCVTGHQGEPRATLARMARGDLPFKFRADDHVVFSCGIIPTPLNQKNRAHLEAGLKRFGVRIFRDIHVSGHAAKEDLRDLLIMIRPEHIIPAHGNEEMKEAYAELAQERGYVRGRTVHLLHDGQTLQIDGGR